MWKIVNEFQKTTTEGIKVAMATAWQAWCKEAMELKMLHVHKASGELWRCGFWK